MSQAQSSPGIRAALAGVLVVAAVLIAADEVAALGQYPGWPPTPANPGFGAVRPGIPPTPYPSPGNLAWPAGRDSVWRSPTAVDRVLPRVPLPPYVASGLPDGRLFIAQPTGWPDRGGAGPLMWPGPPYPHASRYAAVGPGSYSSVGSHPQTWRIAHNELPSALPGITRGNSVRRPLVPWPRTVRTPVGENMLNPWGDRP